MQVKICEAVQTAILRLAYIRPKTCENYLRTWRHDYSNWAENLKSVRQAASAQAALPEMELTATQGEFSAPIPEKARITPRAEPTATGAPQQFETAV